MKRILHMQHSRVGNVLLIVLIVLLAMVALAAVLNVLGWIISGLVGLLTMAFGVIFGLLKWALVFAAGFLVFMFRVGVVALLLGLLVIFVLRALGGVGRGRRRDWADEDAYEGRYSDRWERRHARHGRRY